MRGALQPLTFLDESDIYWPPAWTTEPERRSRYPRRATPGFRSTKLREDLPSFCSDVDHVVARNIRRERVTAGLRQVDLASAIGVTQATLSRLETGKISASLADCIRIAIQLGVALEQLIRPPRTVRVRTGWESQPTVPQIPRDLLEAADEGRLPIDHPIYD